MNDEEELEQKILEQLLEAANETCIGRTYCVVLFRLPTFLRPTFCARAQTLLPWIMSTANHWNLVLARHETKTILKHANTEWRWKNHVGISHNLESCLRQKAHVHTKRKKPTSMRKVTLQQEIAATVVLKQAKWEKMGGWKDPTKKLPSQLVKQVLQDIRKRRSPFFERHDPTKKLRDSIKRSGIHREITKKCAVTDRSPLNCRSNKLGGTGTGLPDRMAHHLVMKDIRNTALVEKKALFVAPKPHFLLMNDIRQNGVQKKRMLTPPKFGRCDETSVASAEVATVLFDQDFTDVSSEIFLNTDPSVPEHLVNLENMIQHLTRQVDALTAQMQALVRTSQRSATQGETTQGGVQIAAEASPTSTVLVNPMEEVQDGWVDVL